MVSTFFCRSVETVFEPKCCYSKYGNGGTSLEGFDSFLSNVFICQCESVKLWAPFHTSSPNLDHTILLFVSRLVSGILEYR